MKNKQCWKYKEVDTTGTYCIYHTESNKLGKNGWELVSVSGGKAYFKRAYWRKVDD